MFDVFGTLVDWRTGIAEAFDASGLDGDPAELADAWRKRYVPILAEVNTQKRPWGNFDELHFVTLDDLLRERGLDASECCNSSMTCVCSAPLPPGLLCRRPEREIRGRRRLW